MKDPTKQIAAELQATYDVGPEYAKAYAGYWFRSRGKEYDSLSQILQSPLPEPIWFDYALSTNWRGQLVARSLEPFLNNGAQRYLDVGCGFGGCLVAFSRLGLSVVGVDIDVQRIRLAQANCVDHALPIDCVQLIDILEGELGDRIGLFDVITCLDVIEHVADVPLALSNMVKLLNPGGLLMLEIPNRHSLAFVARDGHFSLFGITLLERPEAIGYHSAFFDSEYDVGDYYDLSFYQHQLEALGFRSNLIRSDLHPPHTFAEMSTLTRAALQSSLGFFTNTNTEMASEIRSETRNRFVRYLARLALDTADSYLRRRDRDTFSRKYLTDFWTLLATTNEG